MSAVSQMLAVITATMPTKQASSGLLHVLYEQQRSLHRGGSVLLALPGSSSAPWQCLTQLEWVAAVGIIQHTTFLVSGLLCHVPSSCGPQSNMA
jgi:hypothetical protein